MNNSNQQDAPNTYWNRYYGAEQAPKLPSQFALFVANEIETSEIGPFAGVIDLGCGNGRDSLFFAELGNKVVGIDSSISAVTACRERLAAMNEHSRNRARFEVGPADGPLIEEAAASLGGPVLIYSRFFFHAIDDQAEQSVLARIAAALKRHGGTMTVEFRTLEDQLGVRETGAHFRRYVDPAQFASRLEQSGLKLTWSATGRGMAKYRNDDAFVARMIACPW